MKTWSREGTRLVYTAPAGGVTAGVLLIINGTVVAPLKTAAEGAEFVGILTGVVEDVAKSPTFAATVGALAYWDADDGLIYGSDDTTRRRVGVFADACTEGSTYCTIRLDGVSLGAGGDLEDKADKAVPATPGNMAVLNAAGNLEDGGPVPSGGGVPIYPDLTTLKAVPTVAPYGEPSLFAVGTPIAIAEITFPEGGGGPTSLPWILQWYETDLSQWPITSQDSQEPMLVIPNDQWGEDPYGGGPMAGGWISVAMIMQGGDDSDDTLLAFPLPLNQDPDPDVIAPFGGLPENARFLTGPDHSDPHKIATWNGGYWEYTDPEEHQQYKFLDRWALPGGSQRMFCVAHNPDMTPEWSFYNYDGSTTAPYIPILNGFAHQPSELPGGHVPQLGEVFIVESPGAGPWLNKGNRWAWLDGDGVSWMFSGGEPEAGVTGVIGDSNIVLIRDPEDESLYFALCSGSHTRWTRQGGGTTWEDTGLNYILTAGVGVPTIVEYAFGPGNYQIPAFPYPCKLIDAHVVCTAYTLSGTATLHGNAGAQVTGPMACQDVDKVGRPTGILLANANLPAGGHFYFSSSGVSGVVRLTIVRTA